MTSNSTTPADAAGTKPARLYYLNWLRVLAILGIFVFHVFFMPLGMPLFFFLSGAGTWFALRRRKARQYASERGQRLLIPFVVGCLSLAPIQLYFHWRHAVQTVTFYTPTSDLYRP